MANTSPYLTGMSATRIKGLMTLTPGDRSHVCLNRLGPVLDVAQFLQLVVEPVYQLEPVLGLEKVNQLDPIRDNNIKLSWSNFLTIFVSWAILLFEYFSLSVSKDLVYKKCVVKFPQMFYEIDS
jgi:hypothetical protein